MKTIFSLFFAALLLLPAIGGAQSNPQGFFTNNNVKDIFGPSDNKVEKEKEPQAEFSDTMQKALLESYGSHMQTSIKAQVENGNISLEGLEQMKKAFEEKQSAKTKQDQKQAYHPKPFGN